MHSITTRQPTSEERQVLVAKDRPDIASLGCLLVFFGIVPGFLLSKLGSWAGSLFSPQAANYGRWISWVFGLGLFITTLAIFIPYERRRRMRTRQDTAEQMVQEIAVSEPRVFEIGLISDNEPILAFDIGDKKILFLQGQWLREPQTYGAPPQTDDPEEQFLNGLPRPYSFPSSAFTVTRLPHSGRVLRIRVQGDYLAPERTVEALRREYNFNDSELFSGALEDIAAVLAENHARRVSVDEE